MAGEEVEVGIVLVVLKHLRPGLKRDRCLSFRFREESFFYIWRFEFRFLVLFVAQITTAGPAKLAATVACWSCLVTLDTTFPGENVRTEAKERDLGKGFVNLQVVTTFVRAESIFMILLYFQDESAVRDDGRNLVERGPLDVRMNGKMWNREVWN